MRTVNAPSVQSVIAEGLFKTRVESDLADIKSKEHNTYAKESRRAFPGSVVKEEYSPEHGRNNNRQLGELEGCLKLRGRQKNSPKGFTSVDMKPRASPVVVLAEM